MKHSEKIYAAVQCHTSVVILESKLKFCLMITDILRQSSSAALLHSIAIGSLI